MFIDRNGVRRPALLMLLMVIGMTLGAAPVIVVPDRPGKLIFPPGETERYAAEFLRQALRRLTGETPAVVPEREASKHTGRIFLGPTRRARQTIGKLEALRPEALVVKSVENDLILCGEVTPEGMDRGTLFAVYEFLERGCGVRWFFPDNRRIHPDGFGTVFPAGIRLRLTGWDLYDWPRLRGREGGVSHYAWPVKLQKLWHPVLRFGSSLPRRHANHTQIGWYALYGKTHPEYFAVDASGRRRFNRRQPHRNYICPNEPGVLAQMLANLDAADRGEPPAGAWGPRPPEGRQVYFAFNDGMTPENSCQCARCRSQYQPDGPPEAVASVWAFDFVCRYAEALRKRQPARRLATLAFAHYQLPPAGLTIPDNVDVTLVTARLHGATSPERYAGELARVTGWSEKLGRDPDRLGIWLNIVEPAKHVSAAPFWYPNLFRRWLLDTRDLAGSCFINGLNPEMRRIDDAGRMAAFATYPMVWIQSRLMWNPERKVADLLREYTDGLFGPGAEAMRDFYGLLTARWEGCAPPADAYDEVAFLHRVRYGRPQVAEMRRLLEKAAGCCPPGSPERQRVEMLRDRVYAPFFVESERFHRYAEVIPEYRYRTLTAPPDETEWERIPAVALVERQWGGPPEKRAEARMVRCGDALWIRLETSPAAPEDEFRLMIAADGEKTVVRQNYAPNVNRAWPGGTEYRVTSGGAVRDGAGPDARVEWTATADRTRAVVRLPLAGRERLRMQIMRYGGVWDRFDLWNPTLRPIWEFPVDRFGRVLPEKTSDSGE